MSRDPSSIDPSLYFAAPSVSQPTALRTANSHIKVLFDHQDLTSKRVLHFLRDNQIEPDLIHYKYSPLSRRELTGLLKAIPKSDLEYFVKLSSSRYQSRPFTISQQYHEQTINSILPYQGDLLGSPIIYNTLSNCAMVFPPISKPDSLENPFNISPSPGARPQSTRDSQMAEKQRLEASFQDLLRIINPEVGKNKLWDDGGDLFPVPSKFERTRSMQRDWEIQKWEKDQEEEKKAKIDKILANRKLHPWERQEEINNIIDQQAEKLKAMFEAQGEARLSKYSPTYEQDKKIRDLEKKHSRRPAFQSSQIEYDPQTGKPLPESLGMEGGNDWDDFEEEMATMSYPGDQIRVNLSDHRRDLDFLGQMKAKRSEEIYTSREQWRRKQERTFGKRDANEFEAWRRAKVDKHTSDRSAGGRGVNFTSRD